MPREIRIKSLRTIQITLSKQIMYTEEQGRQAFSFQNSNLDYSDVICAFHMKLLQMAQKSTGISCLMAR